jgi:hypothetical protein
MRRGRALGRRSARVDRLTGAHVHRADGVGRSSWRRTNGAGKARGSQLTSDLCGATVSPEEDEQSGRNAHGHEDYEHAVLNARSATATTILHSTCTTIPTSQHAEVCVYFELDSNSNSDSESRSESMRGQLTPHRQPFSLYAEMPSEMYPAIKQVTMYGAEKRPLARPRFWRLVMSPMRMVVSREIPVFPMVYRTSPRRGRQTQPGYIPVHTRPSELRTSNSPPATSCTDLDAATTM